MNKDKAPFELLMETMARKGSEVLERSKTAQETLFDDLDTDIATTPYQVVYEEDRVRLKYYKPVKNISVKSPLLVVYALINRETMLDLQPDRSVIRNLLNEGIEVYMIDWGYPSKKDRFLNHDDHVNGYMDGIVDYIRTRHGTSSINLLGICMGGDLCLMYAALHPEKVKNLVITVTPTNFEVQTGLLHVWSKDFNVDRILKNHGNMPGDMLNLTFLLVNPARLILDKYVNFISNCHDKIFVENFLRMEKWIFDSPDVPGALFREFITLLYQENQLIQNKLELGGRLVDLNNITMPLLNIYARYDHLVPPETCVDITSRVGSKDTENLCLDTGHIGIYVSSKSQKLFVPKIAQWLQQRDRVCERSPARVRQGMAV